MAADSLSHAHISQLTSTHHHETDFCALLERGWAPAWPAATAASATVATEPSTSLETMFTIVHCSSKLLSGHWMVLATVDSDWL
jgi:hypothetical protein